MPAYRFKVSAVAPVSQRSSTATQEDRETHKRKERVAQRREQNLPETAEAETRSLSRVGR